MSVLIFLLLTIYCSIAVSVEQSTSAIYKQCPSPRADNTQQYDCIEIYQPVCAKRDTDIRCITTPCPSTEHKEYSNSCKACIDPKVDGYWPVKCSKLINPQ